MTTANSSYTYGDNSYGAFKNYYINDPWKHKIEFTLKDYLGASDKKDEKDELKKEVDSLKAQLKSAEYDVKEAEELLDIVKKERDSAEESFEVARGERDSALETANDWEVQYADSQDEVDRLHEVIDEHEKEIDKLRKSLASETNINKIRTQQLNDHIENLRRARVQRNLYQSQLSNITENHRVQLRGVLNEMGYELV